MGFQQATIDALKLAYRIIWREEKKFKVALDEVRRRVEPYPEIEMLLQFFEGSRRGILR
jgi:UDP-N-acetylglucosamine acyltransferase